MDDSSLSRNNILFLKIQSRFYIFHNYGLRQNPRVLLFHQLLKLKKKKYYWILCKNHYFGRYIDEFCFIFDSVSNIYVDSDIQYNSNTICVMIEFELKVQLAAS